MMNSNNIRGREVESFFQLADKQAQEATNAIRKKMNTQARLQKERIAGMQNK